MQLTHCKTVRAHHQSPPSPTSQLAGTFSAATDAGRACVIILGSISIVLFGMIIGPLTAWINGWLERAAKAVLFAIGRRRGALTEHHLLHAKMFVALCACHSAVAIGAMIAQVESPGWGYWESCILPGTQP